MTNSNGGGQREIRSYVLRQSKMTAGQKKAYNRLYGKYCIPFREEQLNYRKVFGRDAETILEIGFGMGELTLELAKQNADRNFLAVEVHKPGVGRLLSQIEAIGLKNIRIIHYDIKHVLRHMLPDESLYGVHIFFPDPWPKKRHHKRRLITPPFVRLISGKLKNGAYLYIVTDWADYAEWMLEVLETERSLRNKSKGFSEPQKWRGESKFEKKAKAAGHRIYELYYSKQFA